ncbi:hypothetical protein RB195_014490 [Necator americanus]|uniref:Uncharacterized protein n=1 Tax=Necator americanus TaxID=51031 RepID=A0ABR1E0F4_NECAM
MDWLDSKGKNVHPRCRRVASVRLNAFGDECIGNNSPVAFRRVLGSSATEHHQFNGRDEELMTRSFDVIQTALKHVVRLEPSRILRG